MTVPAAFAGAEARYEDWVLLQMLESEWKRPVLEGERFEALPAEARPSPRAVIAIIFCTYFETKVDRLLRESMKRLPESVARDLLSRYSGISARLERLYFILFGTTYWSDLEALGHGTIALMLKRLRQCRNDFAHGQPSAVSDDLVTEIVFNLQAEHEAWIDVYNLRVPISKPA